MVLDQAQKPVARADRQSSVNKIVSMMDEYNVGCIVITDRDKPVGIITDRDIAMLLKESGKDPTILEAENIMRTPVTTIEAGSNLMQIVQTMASSDVRRLPVVDENDKLVDIVTMDDIVHLIAQTLGGLEDIIESESPRGISVFD